MRVTIHFKQMAVSDATRLFAEQKSRDRLEHYFQGRTNLGWDFFAERGFCIARCRLTGQRLDHAAEGRAPDMRAAIELALDKLDRQLVRLKEIVTDHHRGEDPEKSPEMTERVIIGERAVRGAG
jgi:putative sigma-54 modulation protein